MTGTLRSGSTSGSALYVFAVCRDLDPASVSLEQLPGLTGEEPVRVLPLGPRLAAVAQTVRADDFTDEVWQERLADQRELERYARAHHAVVTAVAGGAPTVPLPMATLYHDDGNARTALTSQTARFDRALDRVAHHSEWGVKVFLSPSRARETESAPVPTATGPERARPAAGSGLAYLNRRRHVQESRQRRHVEAGLRADAVDEAFRRVATEARRLRLHSVPSPEDQDQGVQVLNATYLVAEARSSELHLLAESLREPGDAQVVLSGPWVPYSFVGEVEG
ncbi:GvpL/GvpF family gas vesicle protein [Streptomyces sp. NBC_00102]|uniref:GvpL/GvpF family gas vesicle protein n=1 Tax=Streptomyces sp. NBC_00102 TaxID=2975652 RepID=UPI00224D5BE5|nr:GvpL/GvpF family gas vesicle protein [Streptomyces sp. NBC_00102]MCX5401846.1 GvpL/GvpF family gas vesicle protein [Streptomyces sp. NBC_00102]